MYIVPRQQTLKIEAHLSPRDIDHVRLGQRAELRFSAFEQRTTPTQHGLVSYVSADTAQDPKGNSPFYTIQVVPDASEGEAERLRLVPGMPVEVFVGTGERTVMSFLMKPLADQIARTWREY